VSKFQLMVVVVVVCAAALAGLVRLSSANGAGNAGSLILTVRFDPASAHSLDVGPKGPSVGDIHVYSATLRRAGRTVGRLEGEGIDADPKYDGVLETQYLVLDDGTIAIVGGGQSGAPGVGRPDNKIFDSIVGGSGRYAGAGGWVSVKDLSDAVEQMTLHFTS
jgi:hypothetical protein